MQLRLFCLARLNPIIDSNQQHWGSRYGPNEREAVMEFQVSLWACIMQCRMCIDSVGACMPAATI
jgi:hypothetical protein